jgi:LCP family protein required for cell wall assembly
MSFDPTELLIREALADEAGRAVDPDIVLAELRRGRSRAARYRAPVVVAVAVAVVAAVAVVVVPQLVNRDGQTADTAAATTAQNVLLVGLDEQGTADSIVLAHLGQDGTASAVSLPRDSLVNVPGYGLRKLNSAYVQARTDALAQGHDQADADEAGARMLSTTVQDLTGVGVDHYAVIDMAGFDRLSTAVGGVAVCLNAPSSDSLSGAAFPAGLQKVAGPTALAFLRQRRGLPNGDLDRIVRLQAFLRSLVHQVLSGPTLTDPRALATLLDTVRDNVRVDPGWDLLAFAAQLREVHPSSLRLETIPIADMQAQTANGAYGIGLAPDQVRSFVQAFTTGNPASATTPTPSGSTPPDDVPCVN